jgi:hypothetical protein
MRVLVLHRSSLKRARLREWLGPDATICLIQNAAKLDVDPSDMPYDVVVPVADYDRSGLVEFEARRLHEECAFDRIVAFSEYDLLRAARLRAVLGIAGQDLDSALAFRDKVVMKERLTAGGVAVARFAPVDYAVDLLEFVAHSGFPVVVKPRAAAGSRGVAVLRSEPELAAWLAADFAGGHGPFGSWLVEEFVDGDLFHVDGLVNQGVVEICWPSWTTSCLGFHTGEAIVSHQLDAADPRTPALQDLVRATLASLPHPDPMIFHAEAWQRADGSYLLNEIAGRLGGGPIPRAIERAFSVNLKQRYVLAEVSSELARGPVSAGPPKPYAGYVMLPTPNGTVVALPGGPFDRPWAESEVSAQIGDTYGGARSSMDEIGGCVVVGDSPDEVERRLAEFVDWFRADFEVSP